MHKAQRPSTRGNLYREGKAREGVPGAMRVQIYTNDREQPIELGVRELHHARVKEIISGESGNGSQSIDQTVREIVKDPAVQSANLLFTTEDGTEGAIYLNTQKVAAVVTSWPGKRVPGEQLQTEDTVEAT